MVRYYCPYCNPKYQFQKQSSKGNLICGLCGEDLVKKPFIRLNPDNCFSCSVIITSTFNIYFYFFN